MAEQVRPGASGLDGVVVTQTGLSRVDGEAGSLVIRGFPLEELAPHARFEEVLFLLWNDRLPGAAELAGFCRSLEERRSVPPIALEILKASVAERLPAMDGLRAAVATLGLADPELCRMNLHAETAGANQERASSIVAALPTLVAAQWRLSQKEKPLDPNPDLPHVENYLWMLSGVRPGRSTVRALETYLNTAVDHGMNASTFTARVIISTRSDLLSAVVGALGALKGPLHGGAPGPALDMVFDLRSRAALSGRSLREETETWVRNRVAAGERIMGFGHRVYRVRDPRADVLRIALEDLFPRSASSRLHDDAVTVEAEVLRVLGELKPDRRLQTNVEFYTALLLHGLGLSAELFSPTFAVARVAGWTAQILEQVAEDRLIRPRVAYEGPLDRRWIPVESRSDREVRF